MRSAQTLTQPQKRTGWRFGVQVGLAVAGLLVSLYLTWVKLAHATAFCAGVGDCETVQNSAYSEIGGIPVAMLGAGMYALVILLLWVRRTGSRSVAELAWGAQFALLLAGVLFSAYLTYIELFVIYAICPWCVTSALLVTALFLFAVDDWRHQALQLR